MRLDLISRIGKTTVFWSCHSRKFGKNPGNKNETGKQPVSNAGTELGPGCSGREISRIFWEKSGFREMAFRNADLYIKVCKTRKSRRDNYFIDKDIQCDGCPLLNILISLSLSYLK